MCGWDVTAPRGRGSPSGARESQLFFWCMKLKIVSKIHSNDLATTTTTLRHYIIRINSAIAAENIFLTFLITRKSSKTHEKCPECLLKGEASVQKCIRVAVTHPL